MPTTSSGSTPSATGALPDWRRVLVVVAHPDDESFGLGGVVAAFADQGADVHVLCLTHGEASTLGAGDDLADVRERELALAAERLGVSGTTLLDLPDGRLSELVPDALRRPVVAALEAHHPDGVLVFDPVAGVTGHPDHAAASAAAVEIARERGVPVLGWALPVEVAVTLNAEYGAAFTGHTGLDVTLPVDRARQRRAIEAHASQAVPGSVLWRRLELLGDVEHLRRLAG